MHLNTRRLKITTGQSVEVPGRRVSACSSSGRSREPQGERSHRTGRAKPTWGGRDPRTPARQGSVATPPARTFGRGLNGQSLWEKATPAQEVWGGRPGHLPRRGGQATPQLQEPPPAAGLSAVKITAGRNPGVLALSWPAQRVLWLLSCRAPGPARLPAGSGKEQLFWEVCVVCAGPGRPRRESRAPSHRYLKARNGQVQGVGGVAGCGGGAGMRGPPSMGQDAPWRLLGTPCTRPLGLHGPPPTCCDGKEETPVPTRDDGPGWVGTELGGQQPGQPVPSWVSTARKLSQAGSPSSPRPAWRPRGSL